MLAHAEVDVASVVSPRSTRGALSAVVCEFGGFEIAETDEHRVRGGVEVSGASHHLRDPFGDAAEDGLPGLARRNPLVVGFEDGQVGSPSIGERPREAPLQFEQELRMLRAVRRPPLMPLLMRLAPLFDGPHVLGDFGRYVELCVLRPPERSLRCTRLVLSPGATHAP